MISSTFCVSSPSGAIELPLVEIAGPSLNDRSSIFQAAQIRKLELLQEYLDVDGTPLNKSEVVLKLVGLGRDLYYEIFSPEMRDLYRTFRSCVTTIQIISDEQVIPWELIKPYDDGNSAEVIDDEFLCLRFQLTRWIAGAWSAPPIVYTEFVAFLKAHGSEDFERLPMVDRERCLISQLKDKFSGLEDLSPEPATCESLEAVLATEGLGLVHFAGHSSYDPESPNESSLVLDRPFRPCDLHGPVVTNIRLNRPLVFLNSCGTGRQGLSQIGLAGWAHRWVKHCACGAFIGPQFAIDDELAFNFAEAFYSLVAEGASFGLAALEARKKSFALDPTGLTWLAFSVFAHPKGKLVSGRDPDRGQDWSERERVVRGLLTSRDFPKESPPGRLPSPPLPYIAHRYTLMPTSDLVGRKAELKVLDAWARGTDPRTLEARIFALVAIGGMGKSALSWKWFNEQDNESRNRFAGRFWWSFYEHEATFERFVTHALAYVTRRSPAAVEGIPRYEQEEELLSVLSDHPFLLVLDGLERILVAYARLDAARLVDDDLDQQTAHFVEKDESLFARFAKPTSGGEFLRMTQDPRAGNFLAQLTQVQASRFLVSTRLFPAGLQDRLTRRALPGSTAYFLKGLRGVDSLQLWRVLGVGGEAAELLPILEHIEHHPLVVRALAGEVACYRRAPGDFAQWRLDHPKFDPCCLPLVQARSHILEFSLSKLEHEPHRVAQMIAGLRMPASYEVLKAMLISGAERSFSETTLEAALDELENRGISGWDRVNNEYDMHPLVRGVLWSTLGTDDKEAVYVSLKNYFEALEPVIQYQVTRTSELTPAIELCYSLARLGRHDEAYKVFRFRIGDSLSDFLNSQMEIEILELFFPDGSLSHEPMVSNDRDRFEIQSSLAQAYRVNGQIFKASQLLRRLIEACKKKGDAWFLSNTELKLGSALLQMGSFEEAEKVASRLREEVNGSQHLRDACSLSGHILLNRGETTLASQYFVEPSAELEVQEGRFRAANLAEFAWRVGKPQTARTMIELAFEAYHKLPHFARSQSHELLFLTLQGCTLIDLGRHDEAREILQEAAVGARAINHIELEVRSLIALAEANFRLGRLETAREVLEGVWESVERGPLRLLHADARNVEAAIEIRAGNKSAAATAAKQAFELAWCDGPPFAYHWGLLRARGHLVALGLSEEVVAQFETPRGRVSHRGRVENEGPIDR